MTPVATTNQKQGTQNVLTMDVNEQKQWWQLEEVGQMKEKKKSVMKIEQS